MATKLQIRRGTASAWTAANPTLSQGEMGIETDTRKLKIGDGSTAWTALAYAFAAPNFYIATTQPAGLATGDFWLDSSTAI